MYNIVYNIYNVLPHYLEKMKCSNLLHFVVSYKTRYFLTNCNFVYVHRF